MSRKQKYNKRKVQIDKIYKNKLVAKFINKVMLNGKKSLAEKLVYTSIQNLEAKTETPGLEAFLKAIENIVPKMEVKSRRVGGSTYQVPIEVDRLRGYSLAMRWIIGYAREKSGASFYERLFNELTDAHNKTGSAMKKKEDTHKMAEANKAFSHFRW